MEGFKDGLGVVAGQTIVRKARGAIGGMLPASVATQVTSGPGAIALSLVTATGVSIAARKLAPKQARFIAAGAFAEAINAALAQTPIAPFLSAFPTRRVIPVAARRQVGAGRSAGSVSAWPTARGGALNAWPLPRSAGMPSNAGM